MLSQRSRYALRAMLFLARAPHSPMRSPDIATAAKISPKFLENILIELRKAGLLISNRGCRGGYILARPASQISFADIVRVTDGSLALARVPMKPRLENAKIAPATISAKFARPW